MSLSTSVVMREADETSNNESDETKTDESMWNVSILTV